MIPSQYISILLIPPQRGSTQVKTARRYETAARYKLVGQSKITPVFLPWRMKYPSTQTLWFKNFPQPTLNSLTHVPSCVANYYDIYKDFSTYKFPLNKKRVYNILPSKVIYCMLYKIVNLSAETVSRRGDRDNYMLTQSATECYISILQLHCTLHNMHCLDLQL